MHRHDASSYRPIRTQPVSFDGSVATTNGFGTGIRVIRVVATQPCHYAIAAAPTATTNDPLLPANEIERLSIHDGEKIAFIKQSGGSAGIAYVTELSQ